MRLIIGLVIGLIITNSASGQIFSGKLENANFFLDKQTMKPMFGPVMETVWMNERFLKTDIKNDTAASGGLDWEILDYTTNISYSKQFHPGAKILKSGICPDKNKVFTNRILDTIIDFKGTPSKVMIIESDGEKVGEYYFTDKIKVSPYYYKCTNHDILSYFYSITDGSFLLQRVEYAEDYNLIIQVQKISRYEVSNDEFKVPADDKN